MSLLNFRRKDTSTDNASTPEVEAFLKAYSIEVMPRTAEKVDNFRDLLPVSYTHLTLPTILLV